MEVHIPEPNEALAEILVSGRMREIVEERINTAALLYQAEVAKRTGNLAAAAHPTTEISSVVKGQPRWVGDLVVGGESPRGEVEYAAAHEFGRKAEVEGPVEATAGKDAHGAIVNLDDSVVTGGHHAAHDLQRVLEQLGSI